jgi:hypothetical protein
MRTIGPQRKRRYFGMTTAQIGILGLLLIIACVIFGGGAALLLSDSAPSAPDTAAIDQQPPQTQATATPIPTSTSEPTPTPLPDLSSVVITLEDLPPGFEVIPSDELNLEEILGEEGFASGSSFAFIEKEHAELIMGFSGPLLSKYEQSDFDQLLDYPDYLLDSIVRGMGTADILERKALPGLDNIGETSAGLTLAALQESVPMRVDVVLFRRDTIGAVAYVMYNDGTTPLVPISDIARTLDTRAIDVLPSTE